MEQLLDNIQIIYNRKRKIEELSGMSGESEEDKVLKEKYNELIKKYESLKMILGPSGLTLYKTNDKYIFLLDDYHIEPIEKCSKECNIDKSNCIWISEFLNDLFLVSPFCIDFFLETTKFLQVPKTQIDDPMTDIQFQLALQKAKSSKSTSGLSGTIAKFADCLGPAKKGCEKYKRTRFHNIEYRRFIDDTYDFSPNSYKLNIFTVPIYYLFGSFDTGDFPSLRDVSTSNIDASKYDSNMYSFLGNIKKYSDILKYIISGDMNKLSETILELFKPFSNEYIKKHLPNWEKDFTPDALKTKSPYPKLSKQLNALDSKHREGLETFIREEDFYKIWPKTIFEIGTTLISMPYHPQVPREKVNVAKIYNLLEKLNSELSVLIFDTYTMARILKSIFVYPDSKAILLYAGEYHVNRYRRLFKFMEGLYGTHLYKYGTTIEEIAKLPSKDEACIDLTKYPYQWMRLVNVLKELSNDSMSCSIKPGLDIGKYILQKR